MKLQTSSPIAEPNVNTLLKITGRKMNGDMILDDT